MASTNNPARKLPGRESGPEAKWKMQKTGSKNERPSHHFDCPEVEERCYAPQSNYTHYKQADRVNITGLSNNPTSERMMTASLNIVRPGGLNSFRHNIYLYSLYVVAASLLFTAVSKWVYFFVLDVSFNKTDPLCCHFLLSVSSYLWLPYTILLLGLPSIDTNIPLPKG
jgi:hypothetical protein